MALQPGSNSRAFFVPPNSSSTNTKVLNDRRIGVRRYKTRTAEIQFGEPQKLRS